MWGSHEVFRELLGLVALGEEFGVVAGHFEVEVGLGRDVFLLSGGGVDDGVGDVGEFG